MMSKIQMKHLWSRAWSSWCLFAPEGWVLVAACNLLLGGTSAPEIVLQRRARKSKTERLFHATLVSVEENQFVAGLLQLVSQK